MAQESTQEKRDINKQNHKETAPEMDTEKTGKKIRNKAMISSGKALITSIVLRKTGINQSGTSNPRVDPRERKTAPKVPMMVLKSAMLIVSIKGGIKSKNSKKNSLAPLSMAF